MQTMLLDANWDLAVDANNNMALADPAYSIAQSVANAARLFSGELWYDTTQGVPYRSGATPILGKPPNYNFIKRQVQVAALRIADVASVRVFLDALNASRTVGGQIQITSSTGVVALVNANASTPWYVSAVSRDAAGSVA